MIDIDYGSTNTIPGLEHLPPTKIQPLKMVARNWPELFSDNWLPVLGATKLPTKLLGAVPQAERRGLSDLTSSSSTASVNPARTHIDADVRNSNECKSSTASHQIISPPASKTAKKAIAPILITSDSVIEAAALASKAIGALSTWDEDENDNSFVDQDCEPVNTTSSSLSSNSTADKRVSSSVLQLTSSSSKRLKKTPGDQDKSSSSTNEQHDSD